MLGIDHILLYLVRHGSTEANEEGLFRGHLDYPLDDDGMQAAEDAAYFLAFRPIGHVAASTLKRAVQTAQVIAPTVQETSYGQNMERGFDRNPNLLPWNIGYLAGKSRAKYGDELQGFIDNPDRVPKDGESLDEFRRRIADVLYRYLAQASYQQPIVLVTHSSVVRAAHQALDPGFEDKLGVDDIVEPGGIVAVCVTPDNSTSMVPLLGQVVSDETIS